MDLVRNVKGQGKPIYLIATLAIVVMFIALYYATVSGLLEGSVDLFNSASESIR